MLTTRPRIKPDQPRHPSSRHPQTAPGKKDSCPASAVPAPLHRGSRVPGEPGRRHARWRIPRSPWTHRRDYRCAPRLGPFRHLPEFNNIKRRISALVHAELAVTATE